jgi:hypothetical protein
LSASSTASFVTAVLWMIFGMQFNHLRRRLPVVEDARRRRGPLRYSQGSLAACLRLRRLSPNAVILQFCSQLRAPLFFRALLLCCNRMASSSASSAIFIWICQSWREGGTSQTRSPS